MPTRWATWVILVAVAYAALIWVGFDLLIPNFYGRASTGRILPPLVLVLLVALGVRYRPCAGYTTFDVLTVGAWQGISEHRYLRAFLREIEGAVKSQPGAAPFRSIAE